MPTKRMLVDAIHPEETRVVVTSGNRLEEFDFESAQRQQLRGNIYLAKVTRVEPSLQAAFVEYGGNRHGFLAFSEIHPDYYQIPVADREALLRDEEHDDDHHDHEPSAAAAEAAAETSISLPAGVSEPDAEADTQDMEGAHSHIEEAPVSNEPVESVGGGDTVEDEVPERRRSNNARKYKIQEVIKRRQVMLVQVVKEERGNKGAALTTYLSLAGRYSVLMPNTARGGGISRKITNAADRKRLKEITADLDVPQGMGVILRTAGASRTKAEVKRDYEYLLRLWENVRNLTLRSQAPSLVYEEGSLIKRTIRDLYNKDIDEVWVAGDNAYREAKDFMRMIMPSHAKNVQQYRDDQPLFSKYNVENQLDAMFSPQVTLPSGGYLVINPTEALVSIDVNSGRATKEHNIEDTALQTNLEAAEEIARQLRLRDLAGLIVIDFIDMIENRSNRAVERKLKDCLKNDRARIQVGRISHFGLMEMSRQRIRFGVVESSTHKCPLCEGTGLIRSVESVALMVMRHVEDTVLRRPGQSINVRVPMDVALYILNTKRDTLTALEEKYRLSITITADAKLTGTQFNIEKGETRVHHYSEQTATNTDHVRVDTAAMDEVIEDEEVEETEGAEEEVSARSSENGGEGDSRRRRRRRRRGGERGEGERHAQPQQRQAPESDAEGDEDEGDEEAAGEEANASQRDENGEPRKRRRRGRRGGRRNRRENGEQFENAENGEAPAAEAVAEAEPAEAAAEAPVVEAVAEAPAPEPVVAEAEAAPPAEEVVAEKPKRTRTRKKAAPAEEAPAAEAVAPAAEAVAEEPAAEAKPKRTRTRKKAAAAEEAVAAPAVNETAPAAEPEVAAEAPAEPEKKSRKKALPPDEIIVSSTSAPEAPAAEEQPKKKAGWWQRGFLGS